MSASSPISVLDSPNGGQSGTSNSPIIVETTPPPKQLSLEDLISPVKVIPGDRYR